MPDGQITTASCLGYNDANGDGVQNFAGIRGPESRAEIRYGCVSQARWSDNLQGDAPIEPPGWMRPEQRCDATHVVCFQKGNRLTGIADVPTHKCSNIGTADWLACRTRELNQDEGFRVNPSVYCAGRARAENRQQDRSPSH